MRRYFSIVFFIFMPFVMQGQHIWPGHPDSMLHVIVKHRIFEIQVNKSSSANSGLFDTFYTIRHDTSLRTITVSQAHVIQIIWYNTWGEVDSSKGFKSLYPQDSLVEAWKWIYYYNSDRQLVRKVNTPGQSGPDTWVEHRFRYKRSGRLVKQKIRARGSRRAGYYVVPSLKGGRIMVRRTVDPETKKSSWKRVYAANQWNMKYRVKEHGRVLRIESIAKFPNGNMHRISHEWRIDSSLREKQYYNLLPNDTFLGQTIRYDSFWRITEDITPHPSIADYTYSYDARGVLSQVKMKLHNTLTEYTCNTHGDIVHVDGKEIYRYTYY